jgi:hypothetical protein
MHSSIVSIPASAMTEHRDRPDENDVIPKGHALEVDIRRTLGDDWLSTSNLWLANRKPQQLIGSGEEDLVRDLYRSILVSAVS